MLIPFSVLLEFSDRQDTKPTLSLSKPSPSVGWRSIAIGIILIPVNCYWITYIELVQYSAQPTIVSLIFTVVFNILVLMGFNQILKRFLPRLALSQGELLIIYVMLSVASATAGHSMMEILVSTFYTGQDLRKTSKFHVFERIRCG